MSSLHKLKAYFGMVPVDGDDVDHDGYYDGEYDTEYARDRPSRHDTSRHETARHDRPREGWAQRGDDWDDDRAPERRREPALAGARAHSDGGARGGHDGYDPGDLQDARGESRRLDPLDAPRSRGARLDPLPTLSGSRSGGAPTTRGALAVDTRTEPRREEDPVEQARISTVHPTDYAEAKVVGERFRAGNPVIINLTRMSDADAKRLVDFSAGLAFAMRGSIDKVTTKVFLLSPSAVEFSDEDRRRIVEDGFYNH